MGSCLPASAMAVRFIPEARVISGYAICQYGAFRHHWIRIGSCDIDISANTNEKLVSHELQYELHEACDGTHRFDQESEEERTTSIEHERLVQIYYASPAKRWKAALGWQRKWKPNQT